MSEQTGESEGTPDGPDRDRLIQTINAQIAEVVVAWRCWKQLFFCENADAARERTNFLDNHASAFFGVVQLALLQYVVMIVTRLGDRPHTGKNKNLTLEYLFKAEDSASPPLLSEMRKAVTPLKTIRDKIIAHNDIRQQVDVDALQGVEIRAIDKAIELLIKTTRLHPRFQNTLFEETIASGDASNLLEQLQRLSRYSDIDLRHYQNGLLQRHEST